MLRSMVRNIMPILAAIAMLAVMGGCGDEKKNPAAPGSGGGGGGGGGPDVTISIGLGAAQADTNAYSPRRVTVALGQTVAWKNNDAMAHTATAVGIFNTGLVGAGATSATIPMNTAGDFTYVCTVAGHNMTGFLTVTP